MSEMAPPPQVSVFLGKETTKPAAVLLRGDLDGILSATADGAGAVTGGGVLAFDFLKNRVGFKKLILIQAADDPIKKALFFLAFAGAFGRGGCEYASGGRRECDWKRGHNVVLIGNKME